MNPVDIVLTKDTFVVLASETRLKVLRNLNVRRMTITELADDLGLAKSTVHHHVQILADADFVAAEDDGHAWVYYGLTSKGRALLIPHDGVRIRILLAAALMTLVGGVWAFAKYLTPPPLRVDPVYPTIPGGGGLPLQEAPSSELLYAGIVLVLIAGALAAYAYVRWRNIRVMAYLPEPARRRLAPLLL